MSPPCIGCGRDCAPRQVYCNRCRKALRLEGAGQGRRYGLRMMDSPEADLPRMSDELREAVGDAKWREEAERLLPVRKPLTDDERARIVAAVLSGASVGEAVQATKGTEAECKPNR